MFSYYGTKKRLAPLYPKPAHRIIIEPFAGAAGYSCLYPDNEVHLYDANPKICLVWDYLIQATPNDIQALPDIMPGQSLDQFKMLSSAERCLIGFCINPGSTTPKVTASKRSKWPSMKNTLATFVPKIKHWTVEKRSYAEIPNQTATWFIDPPYQRAGKYYFGFNALNFYRMGRWCANRDGQVIVCENKGATWLPFRWLSTQQGSIQKNIEVVWTRD